MTARFVLAVDGGATKTEAELIGPDGARLAAARTGPCNIYQDAAGGLAAILSAWQACCDAADLDPEMAMSQTALGASLAGTSAPEGRERFFRATAGFARAALSSDAHAALLGAFGGGPGVLLTAGTGTVACRLDASGRFEVRGGWGFPAGDRGGGAWLGLQAMGAWLERLDGLTLGDAADAPIWAEAARIVGRDRASVLAWLRVATPGGYAALAPAVLRAAGAGSALAFRWVEDGCAHLARLVQALAPDAAEVALCGGLAPALLPWLGRHLGAAVRLHPGAAMAGARLIGSGQVVPEFTAPVR